MSTEIMVDDETRAALLLFNERVEASAAAERGRKRIGKAERAKDEAAARVRKVNEDPEATAEQKAEAEAAYKEASDNFQVVKANPLAHEQKKSAKKPENTEATDEASPTEVSADEEASANDDAGTTAQESVAEEAPAESE